MDGIGRLNHENQPMNKWQAWTILYAKYENRLKKKTQ